MTQRNVASIVRQRRQDTAKSGTPTFYWLAHSRSSLAALLGKVGSRHCCSSKTNAILNFGWLQTRTVKSCIERGLWAATINVAEGQRANPFPVTQHGERKVKLMARYLSIKYCDPRPATGRPWQTHNCAANCCWRLSATSRGRNSSSRRGWWCAASGGTNSPPVGGEPVSALPPSRVRPETAL